MARYAITIFLSAFLLFQVQPLIGKFILPWFGGSPAVWTTCMLFFQVVLLAGYSYAHWITSRFTPRAQSLCHLVLLAASLVFLPIAPNVAWKPTGGDIPIERILALLVTTIGLPYFLLSSTGPLLQESFRRETGHPPYRLYSLSNVGSLLALLSYPFLFEPELTLRAQIVGWSIGYGAFVAFCGWCAMGFARLPRDAAVVEGAAEDANAGRPTARDIMLWLGLAACGSVMLLATTNQLCQEISSIPFLWVVPLAIYLLSFIICFDHERWYHRGVFSVLLATGVLGAIYALYQGNRLSMEWQLAIYSATLFVCCMVCHGELVVHRPAPRYATLFYLMVSAGGALGGILVAIVAPLVLHDFWEYHIGLLATVVLAFVAWVVGSRGIARWPGARYVIAGALSIASGVAIGYLISAENVRPGNEHNLETARNFYGVLRVNLVEDAVYGDRRELVNGRIEHGFQYLDPERAHWPTTYYGRASGIGMAIAHHPRRAATEPADRALRIGVVGLGCGTLAAYGEAGDTVRFYEINPEVIRVSQEYFTYRKDCPAQVDIVFGDARIMMERQLANREPQRFDVLAIDAFSSDAIPMHLLTRQCVELFRQHLKPDGLLCIHISNRFLNLSGVVLGIAQALGVECVFIESESDDSLGLNSATWAILTTNQDFLADPDVIEAASTADDIRPPLVWTDDYASMWQVLNR